MGNPLIRRLGNFVASRAILLLLVAAFMALTLIGVAGMSASVFVAESVQGSSSAINVAGSLRRLTHRVSALVVAETLDGAIGRPEVDNAILQFESTLVHPALKQVLARESASVPDAIYRGVVSTWHGQLKPHLLALVDRRAQERVVAGDYVAMLAEVDEFVDQLNALVAVLEHDAEARIKQLSTILAVALLATVGVVLAALYVVRRRVFVPLADLSDAAGRVARRDFTGRSSHTGRDELGRVGESFNAMASELSSAYLDLERRVEKKTTDLRRSNRSLELLYHVIARLYHAPTSAESYSETLRDIEHTLGFKGSFACVQSKHGGAATVLFSSIGECAKPGQDANQACLECPGRNAPWSYGRVGEQDVLIVPLRDTEHVYGMLRLAMAPGQRLETWEATLIEALSRHMGVALGISRQTQRERLLALQEERSVIARELHDSLAQSLSYMKIQVSLLAPVLADPSRRDDAMAVLADLREGINSAYRQLRELLSSFRLQIEGDFNRLLRATTEEFAARSGIPIELQISLGGCSLSPNQEIHTLHIVREALSNATRHAGGDRIWVTLSCDENGEVQVIIDDDGKGLADGLHDEPHHYGLGIMGERARSLHGSLRLLARPGGGTRVLVCFMPGSEQDDNIRENLITLQ